MYVRFSILIVRIAVDRNGLCMSFACMHGTQSVFGDFYSGINPLIRFLSYSVCKPEYPIWLKHFCQLSHVILVTINVYCFSHCVI
jgi:hypothetical protein